MGKFQLFNAEGFEDYVKNVAVQRKITRIQLHHTYSPSYKHFDGKNHEVLQNNMKSYHIKTRGWCDIGQHFTIFPDGIIVSGRSLEKAPAGIYGANAGAVCIECLGNFDKGGDDMTDLQKSAVVAAVRLLLDKFNLSPNGSVTYHAWWTSSGKALGDYVKGQSAKTCPGTAFFGGNTLYAFNKELLPLLQNENPLKEVTEINDIVWELSNAAIVENVEMWLKKCEEDINVYWLCRKMANRLRGITS